MQFERNPYESSNVRDTYEIKTVVNHFLGEEEIKVGIVLSEQRHEPLISFTVDLDEEAIVAMGISELRAILAKAESFIKEKTKA